MQNNYSLPQNNLTTPSTINLQSTTLLTPPSSLPSSQELTVLSQDKPLLKEDNTLTQSTLVNLPNHFSPPVTFAPTESINITKLASLSNSRSPHQFPFSDSNNTRGISEASLMYEKLTKDSKFSGRY